MSSTASPQRYEANVQVEQVPGYGPRLCLLPGDLVAYLVPHPCGGPAVKGWAWDAVATKTRSPKGEIDGTYHVVGTFVPGTVDDATADAPTDPASRGAPADGTFTLSEPPGPPDPRLDTKQTMPDFSSPCPAPPGGWVAADATKATDPALQAANAYATAQPDFVVLWLDHSPNPAFGVGQPAVQGDDYTKLVLDVRFTGDLARHEAAIRDVWGGALCVSQGTRRASDLEPTMKELMAQVPGIISASPDGVAGRVDVGVLADNGTLQRAMDQKYGPGVVVVTSDLHPIRQ